MFEPAVDYKTTLNLPQTTFSMKADAAQKEPRIQEFWQQEGIYERLMESNPGQPFILHDGPPYANGDIHMGHTLNKTLKDIINKYQILRGRKVRYIPGWDCHGLPIELKVLQGMSAGERAGLTPLELRQRAKAYAHSYIDLQRHGFKRLGIWGDWEHPYLTLLPEYEAAQIGVFGQMALKGYIYRGLKPVYWSPSSQTALAEAELEYPEGHTSRSIYVAFPMLQLNDALGSTLQPFLADLSVAIWTTTPWTIPPNVFVRVNPDLTYAVVQDGSRHLIVAAAAVERLSQTFGSDLEVRATFQGQALQGCTYRHPLFGLDPHFDRAGLLVAMGEDVTADSGTGLVHSAPAHGPEDFAVGQHYHLPIAAMVDADGSYTEAAGPFKGLNVLGEAVAAVIEALRQAGALLKEERYAHSYPYDWRTKQPVIYRATEQWFASVDGFRQAALEAIQTVNWIPASGENRITSMVQERSEWCISRQRAWGLPIPVFYDDETGEPLLNAETLAHIQAIFRQEGSDAWWQRSVEELLPQPYRQDGKRYRKGNDTMDVWFDSGSSWAAVAKGRDLGYPVDLYLEGSDQHRGWFQSSLLTSVAANGCAPYKSVLTHGFVLDEKGQKMSKSLGNVVDPLQILRGGEDQKKNPPYGADVLRLWVSSVDYSGDVLIGDTILGQTADIYRKIRNTARFLLSNLYDFDPAQDAIPHAELSEIDRYILHRHREVGLEISDAFDSYQFYRFFQAVQNFCVIDLSNFYLDISKDRLYISHANAPRRRQCQTVLALLLENLARAIAPVLSHMAEEIWSSIPYPKASNSVFESGWIQLPEAWTDPALAEVWNQLRACRLDVNKALEEARTAKQIGASSEAKVVLQVADPLLLQRLQEREAELRYLFIASEVELSAGDGGIRIEKAAGSKCVRCWNYSVQVGESSQHPELCERCVLALAGKF